MQRSNHIEDLLTMYKAMPNGEWRNKVISHLKDALAAAKMMEGDETRSMQLKRHDGPANGQLEHVLDQPASANCVCPAGARDSQCPVHGGTFATGGYVRPPLPPPSQPGPAY